MKVVLKNKWTDLWNKSVSCNLVAPIIIVVKDEEMKPEEGAEQVGAILKKLPSILRYMYQ